MPTRKRAPYLKLAGGAAAAGYLLWERKNPSPCPYALRFLVDMPRPYITVGRLRQVLEPRPGERVLEIGPGPGHHSLSVAEALAPGGSLDAFDIQQEMLDELMSRARNRGIENITPTQGDARDLPYPDATFDGAFLITVLGEIPDQDAALRELRRVLKPDGRLVVGEIVLDPHFVTLGALQQRAEAAGFRFERRLGPPAFGYMARFAPAK